MDRLTLVLALSTTLVLPTGCKEDDWPDDSGEPGDTDTDTDTDSDTDTDTDSDTDTDTGGDVTLTMLPSTGCTALGAVGPGVGEEAHWAAVRFTPPAYPFFVETVRVTLVNDAHIGGDCDATGAYEVELWVGLDPEPPSVPVVREDWTYYQGDSSDPTRVLEGTMAVPYQVPDDHEIFVGFDFAGQSGTPACIQTCADDPQTDHNFWSNFHQPPFMWGTLADHGQDVNLVIEVDGHY